MSNNNINNTNLIPIKDYANEYERASMEWKRISKQIEKMEAKMLQYQKIINLSKAKRNMGIKYGTFEKLYYEYEQIQVERKIGESLIKNTIYLNEKNLFDLKMLKRELAPLKEKKTRKRDVLATIRSKENEISRLEEIIKQNQILIEKATSPLFEIIKKLAEYDVEKENRNVQVQSPEKKSGKKIGLFNKESRKSVETSTFYKDIERDKLLKIVQEEVDRRETVCRLMVSICSRFGIHESDFSDMENLSADESQIQALEKMLNELQEKLSGYGELKSQKKYLEYQMENFEREARANGQSLKKDLESKQKSDMAQEIADVEFPMTTEMEFDGQLRIDNLNKKAKRVSELKKLDYEELAQLHQDIVKDVCIVYS